MILSYLVVSNTEVAVKKAKRSLGKKGALTSDIAVSGPSLRDIGAWIRSENCQDDYEGAVDYVHSFIAPDNLEGIARDEIMNNQDPEYKNVSLVSPPGGTFDASIGYRIVIGLGDDKSQINNDTKADVRGACLAEEMMIAELDDFLRTKAGIVHDTPALEYARGLFSIDLYADETAAEIYS